jgi:hypothetical protein
MIRQAYSAFSLAACALTAAPSKDDIASSLPEVILAWAYLQPLHP